MLSNNAKVLDAVRNGKSRSSKKDVAEVTGLAWGTMCKVVDSLLEREVIFGRRERTVSPGRPSIPLCVNADAVYWCGIDLGAASTRIVFCDLNFNIIYRDKVPTPSYRNPESLHKWLKKIFGMALKESGIDSAKLAGVGMGISGIVDSDNGVIVSGGNWGLKNGVNLPVSEIAAVLGYPVYAVTTQAAAVTAEYRFGKRAGCANLVTIGLGVGIGSGVIANHQLLISHPRRPVGYIGHILIPGNQHLCSCGFRGCLESYSGGNYLKKVAGEQLPERPELHDAAALDYAAANGDPAARKILNVAASYNAVGVAGMIQLYSPDALIFSGAQSRNDGYLYLRTLEELRGILPEERRNCFIDITGIGEFQSALGAVRLAYEKFF